MTETQRRSIIAIPGLTTPPVPDASIDAFDRRHLCDVPATVATIEAGIFFFWRKETVGLLTNWARQTEPAASASWRRETSQVGTTWRRQSDTPKGG